MSDPVTDVEIEDVLSSIRRLVGNEHRLKASPRPVELPKKPTKLVLTPSLLVPVPDTPEDEPETDQMRDPNPDLNPDHAGDEPEPDSVETLQPDQSDTEFETLETDPEAEAEADPVTEAEAETNADAMPESSVDMPQESTASAAVSATDTDPESGQHPEAPAVETSAQDEPPAPWHDPDTTLFEAGEVVENTDTMDADNELQQTEDGFVEDETVSSGISDIPDVDQHDATGDDDTPDTSDQDGTVDGIGNHNTAQLADLFTDDADDDPFRDDPETEAASEGHPEASDDTDPDDTDPDDTDPEDDVPYSTATLSAKIAALEAKIGQTQDQWEPDGESGDDYAGTRVETIEWKDHHGDDSPEPRRPALDPAALNPEFASAPPPDTDADPRDNGKAQDDGADSLDILGEDDAILDEESLRELVADIVRQELQGALGERITRNVRKLVRREIHRALTAQELD